jgi:hypothetical protein
MVADMLIQSILIWQCIDQNGVITLDIFLLLDEMEVKVFVDFDIPFIKQFAIELEMFLKAQLV